MTAQPAALRAIAGAGKPEEFDADARTKAREETPVVIAGVRFTRRKKDWKVSRAMRKLMRIQESALALNRRLRIRIAELDAEQVEAAAKGEDDKVAELEGQIDELVGKGDEATENGELVSYRLLALLLVPPAEAAEGETTDAATTAIAAAGPLPRDAFGPGAGGPLELEDVRPALEWLQPALDVEDAAALANDLSGSSEPDPPETPSSGSGSA
jgi:hypothetical protein